MSFIQIFGPKVAKYELEKHLESAGLSDYIVSIDNAEKMTDLKIAEKVLKRFPLRSRYDLSCGKAFHPVNHGGG